MSGAASLTAGVAGRYATALYELAREAGAVDKVESDLLALEAALAESDELRDLLSSAVYSREDQGRAVVAVAGAMGLGAEVTNTLGVMAANRRLFVVPAMIASVKALVAEARGEVTAEVVSAHPLTDAQRDNLLATLRDKTGKSVKLDARVDEALIGGMVVHVGSRMIDTSIRTKLANLQNILKEVG